MTGFLYLVPTRASFLISIIPKQLVWFLQGVWSHQDRIALWQGGILRHSLQSFGLTRSGSDSTRKLNPNTTKNFYFNLVSPYLLIKIAEKSKFQKEKSDYIFNFFKKNRKNKSLLPEKLRFKSLGHCSEIEIPCALVNPTQPKLFSLSTF